MNKMDTFANTQFHKKYRSGALFSNYNKCTNLYDFFHLTLMPLHSNLIMCNSTTSN